MSAGSSRAGGAPRGPQGAVLGALLLPPFAAWGGNRFVAMQVQRDGALCWDTSGMPQGGAPLDGAPWWCGGPGAGASPPVPARLASLLEGGVPGAQCARVHELEEGLGALHPHLRRIARLLASAGLPSLPAEVGPTRPMRGRLMDPRKPLHATEQSQQH